MVESGYCGRRTAYTRLKWCRLAGFEPDLVRFSLHKGVFWEAEEREMIRHLEDDYRAELAEAERRPLLLRLMRSKPKPHPDLTDDGSS